MKSHIPLRLTDRAVVYEAFVEVLPPSLLDQIPAVSDSDRIAWDPVEEISESTANRLKRVPPEQIDGGMLYKLDWADYRRNYSIWQRFLRMFQK